MLGVNPNAEFYNLELNLDITTVAQVHKIQVYLIFESGSWARRVIMSEEACLHADKLNINKTTDETLHTCPVCRNIKFMSIRCGCQLISSEYLNCVTSSTTTSPATLGSSVLRTVSLLCSWETKVRHFIQTSCSVVEEIYRKCCVCRPTELLDYLCVGFV